MSSMLKILAILGVGAVLVGGWLYYADAPTQTPEPEDVPAEEVEEFSARMRAETVARVGQPIEGFEPFMFMQAFPGLIASDFADVDALIGLYRYEDGEIVYDLNGEVELHSAARAISDEGMAQLFNNISSRITFMQGEDAVEQVFFAISPESLGNTPAEGGSITVPGTITCLPHKGDGPHTMECAFGLEAESGEHYGLSNLWTVAPDITDTNVDVVVTGTFVSALADEKYDIVGYIEVESAVRQ